MDEVFVVICNSCDDCGEQGGGVFSHYPTDEDIESIKEDMGGMYCIDHKIYFGKVDSCLKEVVRQ